MYATEKDFSKAFTDKLKRVGFTVTRLESHSTGNGIPDIFICGHGFDCFIELKNDKKHRPKAFTLPVEWRPGQRAWMLEYFLKHKYKKNCLTIVAVKEGYYIIPMTCMYENSTVYNSASMFISKSDWSKINIARVLHVMTDYITGFNTYREAIIGLVMQYYPYDIDYDPEVLWDEETIDYGFDAAIFNSNKLEILLTLETTMKNVD